MRPLFSSPAQPPSPQQPSPTATALAARRHPHAAVPAATAAPRSNHSLLQPPPPQRPPYLSQRRVADEPWRRMFAARAARRRRAVPAATAPATALPAPATPAAPPRKARIHPSCCDCFTAAPGKNRAVCILFSTNACNKPSSWQYLPEMYAFRDRNGKILALCVHFQVQSGGFGYMA